MTAVVLDTELKKFTNTKKSLQCFGEKSWMVRKEVENINKLTVLLLFLSNSTLPNPTLTAKPAAVSSIF